MITRSNFVALALSAFGVLAFSSLSTSAAIGKNAGDCSHTHEVYTYPPGARVEIDPDNWHWRHGKHFAWKEHEGRGYWRDGTWVTIPLP